MTYTDLAASLARCKERTGATSADDAYLTELLQLSAGKDATETTHYRPFLVAALWLEQAQSKQQLSEAKGVKFTGLAKPIASLKALQFAYDQSNKLSIPDGFETVTSQALPRFGTQSQSTQIRP